MRPHPQFESWSIPARHRLDGFHLAALGVGDLERDYSAVMESAADIRAANPGVSWPEGLTRQANMVDLAWHQREFELKRSFAWVIENAAGEYLGCAYVYPALTGEALAHIAWWWRTGAEADRAEFRRLFSDWLAGPDWPALEYRQGTV